MICTTGTNTYPTGTTTTTSTSTNVDTTTSKTYTINSSPWLAQHINLDGFDKIIIKGHDLTDALKKSYEDLIELQKEIEANREVPRPPDPIEQVYFNYNKGATTVKWTDGTFTTVRNQGEDFDEEKAIALCFMKKAFDNRSCFNESLKKWVIDAEYCGNIVQD